MNSTATARAPFSAGETSPSQPFDLPGNVQRDNLTLAEFLPTIQIADHRDWFRIIVPVGDVDLRNVWIFAKPRSVSIEIRSRDTVAHGDSCCEEIDEWHVTRELKLPQYIKEGCTTVMPLGSNLEIMCVKDAHQEDRSWVEMLRFDTRASIGSI